MPLDVLQNMRSNRKRNFSDFFSEQLKKAPKRKPTRVKPSPKMRGTLFAKRNKTTAIREAAKRRVSIIIIYKKITTGETKKYEINVLSYRFRKLKAGRRKVLYGLDKNDKNRKQLKNFVVRNIKNVILTDRKYKTSGYPVEIH